ncbi:MAG: HEAT repeat domain-containing protein, partial [Bacteroidota bacterium]
FVGQIVEHLATRTNLDEWDGKTALPEIPLAIQCLSEVRGITRLEDAGSRLLQQVISVATKAGSDVSAQTFMTETLVAACEELGQRWPSRQQLRPIAISHVESFPEHGYGPYFWPYLITHVLGDRTILENLATQTSGIRSFRYRRAALQALAGTWPDEATRALLTARVVEDERYEVRGAALYALSGTWPDKGTQALLTERAAEDESNFIRRVLLELLSETWPDEATQAFLTDLSTKEADPSKRGAACSALGKMHSEFGRILPTRDLDGVAPYLDPLKPIPRAHIEKAAAKAGIQPEDIDAEVASLSAFLGWDITVGLKGTP